MTISMPKNKHMIGYMLDLDFNFFGRLDLGLESIARRSLFSHIPQQVHQHRGWVVLLNFVP